MIENLWKKGRKLTERRIERGSIEVQHELLPDRNSIWKPPSFPLSLPSGWDRMERTVRLSRSSNQLG
jgi:hypothetical protein